MARVKRGLMRHKRHKKVIERASGYWGRKKNVFSRANEQVMKAGQYAFRDRRAKKRDFRKLWIVRITAGCTECGVKYSQLIHGLTEKGIQVNRKMLSELVIADMDAFRALAQVADFFRRTEPHSPVAYLAERAASWGEMPLHVWLRAVIKDPSAIAGVEELLGAVPAAD